jgi:hypothetical protein
VLRENTPDEKAFLRVTVEACKQPGNRPAFMGSCIFCPRMFEGPGVRPTYVAISMMEDIWVPCVAPTGRSSSNMNWSSSARSSSPSGCKLGVMSS